MGGVLTTRRVASVPLKPTRTVPQTKPTTHTQGSSVYCSENSRRAKYYKLTRKGQKQLESETLLWRRLTKAVDCILDMA